MKKTNPFSWSRRARRSPEQFGLVLSTSPKDSVRNGKRSLELALKACELTEYKAAHILSTLASAYAETGDFEKARQWSGKAVELGTAEDNEQLDQLKKELESYKENKPWREEQKPKRTKSNASKAKRSRPNLLSVNLCQI